MGGRTLKMTRWFGCGFYPFYFGMPYFMMWPWLLVIALIGIIIALVVVLLVRKRD